MISLTRVTKSFGGRTVLNDVTLQVARGECVRITGAPKSGRTTLLRVIATLIHPTSGGLSVDGIDGVRDPVAARRKMVYVSPDILTGTRLRVDEYLWFVGRARGRSVSDRHVAEACDRCGLARGSDVDRLSPDGPIYQACTFAGNPVTLAAGLANLEEISKPGFFKALTATTGALTAGLRQRAAKTGVPLTTHAVGGMFGIFFTPAPRVTSFAQVMACDVERFRKFFHGMLREGVYLAPSAYEAGFVSAAHTEADIAATLESAEKVFATL